MLFVPERNVGHRVADPHSSSFSISLRRCSFCCFYHHVTRNIPPPARRNRNTACITVDLPNLFPNSCGFRVLVVVQACVGAREQWTQTKAATMTIMISVGSGRTLLGRAQRERESLRGREGEGGGGTYMGARGMDGRCVIESSLSGRGAETGFSEAPWIWICDEGTR